MAMGFRPRARPAHAPGPTHLCYTPDGKKLITVGLNNAIRIFATGSDAEPASIDVPQESHTAVVAANDFFITGSEDGTVCKYSLATKSLDEILLRCTLPVRDVALSRDGEWVAVASDELVVKVVNTRDMTRVRYLREQSRPVKNVSFDFSGSKLAVSCSDGLVYVYSLSSDQPVLLKRVDGLIKMLETDSQLSAKVIWHPDGRALAAPTATKAIQVVSTRDWTHQRAFTSNQRGDFTAAAWSPNGAVLATAGTDLSIMLWNTKTQQYIYKVESEREPVSALAWHPTENILAYVTHDGELYMHNDVVPREYQALLEKTLAAAPLLNDPLTEIDGNVRKDLANSDDKLVDRRRAAGTPDSLDDLLGPDAMSETGDPFIEDDDGAGYAEDVTVNVNGKRPGEDLGAPVTKRVPTGAYAWQPILHEPFQPGSTPWMGNRRYLCLNLTGMIWTVDQDTHHSITVEFYDTSVHRNFHFTDPFLYDRACLGEHGAAFSCPASAQHPSLIYFRPHETWTSRTDWRTQLPKGEQVTALSLSSSCVFVTTTAGYVRVYSLFGLPLRIYRQKTSPTVTCASWRDYILTVTNGPLDPFSGTPKLLYSIENVKRDEVCQAEDVLPLAHPSSTLRAVFWSDTGDPCIFDSDGVLLVALHWRIPGQAKWVPLLDTTRLARLAAGRKQESYWPVAVAENKFYCIILKGGERYPYFPKPLLSDFEFRVPVTSVQEPEDDDGDDDDDEAAQESETHRLEESFVRTSLLHSLASDLVDSTSSTHSQRADVARREVEVDKTLLQLLAIECREGEERGMKALEIVGLLRDASGRMVEAAGKIAARFGREVLGEKIGALAERRLVGLADEDEEGL